MKSKKLPKREALTVTRFINEFLVNELRIPLRKIVNDTTFNEYTGSKRPDLLISDVEFDLKNNNEKEFISNLICYSEVKDNSSVGDKDWKDAVKQGLAKSKNLEIPYFVVTNCKVSYFYNSKNGKELSLNGNPIREFQSLDVLKLIIKKLSDNKNLTDIETSIDIQSSISETIFNKKLWELARIYRSVDFKTINEKIDFTIGFIALKFYEEKITYENKINKKYDYWSDISKYLKKTSTFSSIFQSYIKRISKEIDFQDYKLLLDVVNKKIEKKEVKDQDLVDIYTVIDSAGTLHGTGFDLFGSVYEKFASIKEKSDFGEFFTRRHYTRIFTKLLLLEEDFFDPQKKFRLIDPACGTGGFLTEAYKVIFDNFKKNGTLNKSSKHFLKHECIYGFDVKSENISRAKLNMFFVGDGQSNLSRLDSLSDSIEENFYDYVAANPPIGNGTVKAETSAVSTIRSEIAFLAKIIKILKVGGRGCVIMPDGFFENPSFAKFRKEVLEKCEIESIISLPKFAFAPYTKEKTYALFFRKKNNKITKIQNQAIWMYIIDNDGYANSDKRFPTKLKNDDGKWLHDELSSWVNNDGDEQSSILEKNWNKFDDQNKPSSWIDEKGKELKLKKGGFIEVKNINESNYFNLLPEKHLRPYKPNYITLEELSKEVSSLLKN